MSSKKAFSRSDVAAIAMKMTAHSNSAATDRVVMNVPTSPVAAKVIRDVGVSREKMQQAYAFAKRSLAAK